MKVELFQSAGCRQCASTRDELKKAAEIAVPGLVWREVDAAAELDYAVDLGVLSLPAVAVDGRLVFSSLPTPGQLGKELSRRASKAVNGY